MVLAVGNQWHPNLPDLPGEFTGEAFHSQAYRDPAVLRGRRVLVVGAGNSGCDIACDAAANASFAALSTRRGYRFVPKYVLGQPTDVFAHRGPSLPAPVGQKVLTRLKRTDADLEGGLHHVDSPRHSYYQRNATYLGLARELLRQLREGQVTGEPLEVGTVAAARRSARRWTERLRDVTRAVPL